jgi:beta-glucosidase
MAQEDLNNCLHAAFRHGTYSVAESLNAGMDLEMPGPPKWRQNYLVQVSLTAQKLFVPTINDRVRSLLTFFQHQARQHPDIVYGDGKEGSNDSPGVRKFCRKLAADGIVLLKNDDEVLPLKQDRVKRIAVVGPNAKARIISGGGSAALQALYTVSPYEGIENGAYKGLSIDYDRACYGVHIVFELLTFS